MTSLRLPRFILPLLLAFGLGGCVAYGADYVYGGGGGYYAAPAYVAPAYGYRAPRYYSPPPPSYGGYGYNRPHHRPYRGW